MSKCLLSLLSSRLSFITLFKFVPGNTELNIVEEYKYLGIVLNELLDYDVTAQVLSDAANRALGSVINKYKSINGLGYNTYTRFFQSGVCPILDYGSEIWGYKSFKKIDAIQDKAIRIYLVVHRFAPTVAVSGDIGNTWSSDIRSLLSNIDQARAFQTRNMDCTKATWTCLLETYCNQWKIESLNKPKLRTYVKFKTCFKMEDYVMLFMSRRERSYLAQLRCGILPLHIETGDGMW